VSVITLTEGTALPLSAWPSRLHVGSGDVHALIDAKVLRLNDQGEYTLTFVGIVVFNDQLLFSQPKFGAGATFTLTRTLEILRSYFRRSRQRRPILDHFRDPEYGDSQVLREFDALIGLRDWFNAHGLYRREQPRTTSTGRTHWVRTIGRRIPLSVQGEVIYPLTVAERREGMLNEISSLHIGILQRLTERYGLPVSPALRHAELATGTLIEAWPLRTDTRTYYQRRVAKEQRDVFRTDALHLLNLLDSALDSRLAEPSAVPQIFGTTAFYAVWEDACRAGIGRYISPTSLAELGQPVSL
jgi:hypothetical protein